MLSNWLKTSDEVDLSTPEAAAAQMRQISREVRANTISNGAMTAIIFLSAGVVYQLLYLLLILVATGVVDPKQLGAMLAKARNAVKSTPANELHEE